MRGSLAREATDVALYQCTWRWPGTGDSSERRVRFGEALLAADRENPGLERMIRGWYAYPGEWAGFLIMEADSGEDLSAALRPFTGLMTWDVKPLVAQDYGATKRRLTQAEG